MHVAGKAANESFVNFNMAVHFFEKRSSVHCQADAMIHKPSGLLGNTQVSRNLIRANAVFAIDDHPYSAKPLIQAKRRVFKDSSYLCGELALLVGALTLPFVLLLKECNVVTATGRTGNTIWPTASGQIGKAILWIREINNCLLERFGFGLPRHSEGRLA
ncbi:MAG TPA: hypothetical protein VE135_00920 [Pyrinomonadaceae bacterium]|nr:hypothetical protein [Pyrinomonadaceae bacterium]